jgi:hypothetical protein
MKSRTSTRTAFQDDFDREVEKQAREAAADSNWRDILTAPKDEGVRVLLSWDNPNAWVQIGFWSGEYHGVQAWCDDYNEKDFIPQPTHWMPLPTPPKPSGEQS